MPPDPVVSGVWPHVVVWVILVFPPVDSSPLDADDVHPPTVTLGQVHLASVSVPFPNETVWNIAALPARRSARATIVVFMCGFVLVLVVLLSVPGKGLWGMETRMCSCPYDSEYRDF